MSVCGAFKVKTRITNQIWLDRGRKSKESWNLPIEFVENQRSAVAANVLDLCQLGVGDHLACRVAWVGSQDNRCTTRNFLGDLIRRHMILVCLAKRNRNRCNVAEK